MAGDLPQAYKVLIADDSEDDRYFLRRVLDRFKRFSLVGEVDDGEQAIDYLAGRRHFSDREKYPLPDLVLLDLKMPRKTGFEVLQWLHTEWFPRLTVIVLSGSNLAEDVGASLAFGARGYWTKTSDTNRQDRIAGEIEALLDGRWKKWIEAMPAKPGIRGARGKKQSSRVAASQPHSR